MPTTYTEAHQLVVTLVSGPNRCGKSVWAEGLLRNKKAVTYIATSDGYPEDKDWQERVKLHKKRRPKFWTIIESNTDLIEDINKIPFTDSILIDSIGGLVTSHLSKSDAIWQAIQIELINTILNRKANVVIVTEEVGWGVVPGTLVGNLFMNRICELNNLLQQISLDSWLVINGRAINLKEIGLEVK